jgi:hypothetical protein
MLTSLIKEGIGKAASYGDGSEGYTELKRKGSYELLRLIGFERSVSSAERVSRAFVFFCGWWGVTNFGSERANVSDVGVRRRVLFLLRFFTYFAHPLRHFSHPPSALTRVHCVQKD